MNSVGNAGKAPILREWSFDELVREGLSLIPAYAPVWTNYNPSDPGITLLELLAYFSEILTYRAARISPDALLNLLRLMHEPDWQGWRKLLGQPVVVIEEAIQRRVQALSHVHCAVTAQDFELLAVQTAMQWLGPSRPVQAKCVPSADLRDVFLPGAAPAGDMSVILAPEHALAAHEIEALSLRVYSELVPRCLLTSRVHVIGPVYLDIQVGCHIAVRHGFSLETAVHAADEALRRRFGPSGVEDPPAPRHRFGRPVHLSEIAEVIDACDVIDYVENITLRRIDLLGQSYGNADARIGVRTGVYATIGEDTRLGGLASIAFARLARDATGEVATVQLQYWELARVRLTPDAVIAIQDAAADTTATFERAGAGDDY